MSNAPQIPPALGGTKRAALLTRPEKSSASKSSTIPFQYLIVDVGGKQHRAKPGTTFWADPEKGVCNGEPGDLIRLDRVVFVRSDNCLLGTPYVEGASATARILRRFKGPKLHAYNYKAKKNQRKRWGHRQNYVELEVLSLQVEPEILSISVQSPEGLLSTVTSKRTETPQASEASKEFQHGKRHASLGTAAPSLISRAAVVATMKGIQQRTLKDGVVQIVINREEFLSFFPHNRYKEAALSILCPGFVLTDEQNEDVMGRKSIRQATLIEAGDGRGPAPKDSETKSPMFYVALTMPRTGGILKLQEVILGN